MLIFTLLLAAPVLAIGGALLGGVALSIFMPIVTAVSKLFALFETFYLRPETPKKAVIPVLKYVSGYVVGSSVIATYIYSSFYSNDENEVSDKIMSSMITAGLFILFIRVSKFMVSKSAHTEMIGVIVGAYYILPFIMVAIATKRSLMPEKELEVDYSNLEESTDREYYKHNPFTSFFLYMAEHIGIIIASIGVLAGMSLLGLLYEYTIGVYPVNQAMMWIGLALIAGAVISAVKYAELS